MKPNPDITHETLSLVEAVCDGTADDAQLHQLETLLASDETVRNFYVDFLNFNAELQWFSGAMQGPDATAAGFTSNAALLACDPSSEDAGGLVRENLWHFSGWPAAYLIASMLLGIAFLIGSFLQVPSSTQIAGASHAENNEDESEAAKRSIVARITGLANCQWQFESAVSSNMKPDVADRSLSATHKSADLKTQPIKKFVALGDKLFITSGLMEVTYRSGAKIILQGPAVYEVDSKSGGYLSVGKLTARVEKKGFRAADAEKTSSAPPPLFALRTPLALLTDLGTEFGVEVAQDGATKAVVLQGSIRVALSEENPNSDQAQVLTVNQSVSVSRHRIEPYRGPVALANHFVRSIPSEADRYVQFVLSLHPLVYYRMERPEQGADPLRVIDSAAGRHHGELFTSADPARAWQRGRFGNAIAFQGVDGRQYVRVKAFPDIATGLLSVSAWVWADSRPPWATIVKNWGNSVHGAFHLGLDPKDSDLHAFISQANGERIEVCEGRDHPFPIGHWQHVALVVDGQAVHLYRNGIEVSSTPANGLGNPASLHSLGIGCKLDDAGNVSDTMCPGYWGGRIDELAIFETVLSPETIRQLAALPPQHANAENAHPSQKQ